MEPLKSGVKLKLGASSRSYEVSTPPEPGKWVVVGVVLSGEGGTIFFQVGPKAVVNLSDSYIGEVLNEDVVDDEG